MVSVNMEYELSKYNLDKKWNDYIAVQKEVISVLRQYPAVVAGPPKLYYNTGKKYFAIIKKICTRRGCYEKQSDICRRREQNQ